MPARDMMLIVLHVVQRDEGQQNTEIGIVTIGTIDDGRCQRKIRITSETMIISIVSSVCSVSNRALDQGPSDR